MKPLAQLTREPAVGLGVAIAIGLALGTGTLGGLLSSLHLPTAPAPTPAPSSTPAAGGPVARPPSGDLAAHLDTLSTVNT